MIRIHRINKCSEVSRKLISIQERLKRHISILTADILVQYYASCSSFFNPRTHATKSDKQSGRERNREREKTVSFGWQHKTYSNVNGI